MAHTLASRKSNLIHVDTDGSILLAGDAVEAAPVAASANAALAFSLPANLLAGLDLTAAHTVEGSGNDTKIVGTSFDDILTVTTDTAKVNGKAGNDVAVFEDVSNSYYSWYHINADASGGYDVVEAHATGQTVHILNVETLKFNDGTYDVATGVFTPASSGGSGGGGGGGGSNPAPPAHQILAPSVPQASGHGDIVGLMLQNTTAATEASGSVSFAEVFAKGAVSAGSTLVAEINGHDVAVQMDVKSTNPDGSVRQAILTFEAPQIAAGNSVAVMLAKGSAPGQMQSPITASSILRGGYDMTVNVAIHNADGTTTNKTVDAAKVLKTAIADGNVTTWLSGPQAGEVAVTAKVAANLTLTFDIHQDAGGQTSTTLSFSRDIGYSAAVSTLNYDVSAAQNGSVVFTQNHVQQYAYSTWDAQIGQAGVDPHVVYDMQYLENTGAIPYYDLTAGVASGSIANGQQALSAGGNGVFGTGSVTTYMPETGGRGDIGVDPTWVAEYLVSQDANAEQVMYADAGVAGSIPWHLVDKNGQPILLTNHPDLWIDSRGEGSIYGSDALPVPFTGTGGAWTLDTSHEPNLSYVPYLLSGDLNDLNNLKDQAAYVIASFNPGYRGVTNDLIADGQQVRGKAWDLRDIGNAAFALPNSDPTKAYFTKVVNDNLQHIIDTYVHGAAGAAEGQLAGWIGGDYGEVPGVMAPWQQDYFAIVMNQLGEQGFTKAYTILAWEDNFLSGRFLNTANGFNPNEGLAYNLQAGDSTTGVDYTTWAQVYSASFGTTQPTTLQGDATSSGGYGANARAALASDVSGTESVNAIHAYAWLVGQTPEITTAFASDPTWDIVPKLADGLYLTADKIKIATGDQNLTGGNADSLLLGGTGKEALTGGTGIDILLGGSGSQTLTGNAGNDYIFAGTGNQTIRGGAGADHLEAGSSGHNTFVYGAASESTSAAYDTIQDFNFTTDSFDLNTHVLAIDPARVHGSLSTASFDADLTKDIGVTQLGAHHAMLFTASAGTLSGDAFLVVDLNGVAGYQAGSDLVVQLQGATGTLALADFT